MLLINISIIEINSIILFLGGWYLGDIQTQRQSTSNFREKKEEKEVALRNSIIIFVGLFI